ncbi:YaeQ family protein [Planctomycetota bacterium]|nr:YaeQ family protein [Planctomycetota bacterium]
MRMNIDLSVNDYDRDLFETRKLIFEMRDGESPVHIALKLVSLALYFDQDMQVEPPMNADDRYKPDLLTRFDDWRPKLWVECGQCRVQKLDKITFRYYDAAFVMVKRTAREAREIKARCESVVRRLDAISFVGFDNDFIDSIGKRLMGKNDFIAIVSGDDLDVVIAGDTLTTKIHKF